METTVIVRGWNLDYLWSKFTDPTFWSDPAVVVLIGLVAIFVVALMIVLPNKPINQLTDQDNLGCLYWFKSGGALSCHSSLWFCSLLLPCFSWVVRRVLPSPQLVAQLLAQLPKFKFAQSSLSL
jgi:hypothetical protein